jgi:hypothetical protein
MYVESLLLGTYEEYDNVLKVEAKTSQRAAITEALTRNAHVISFGGSILSTEIIPGVILFDGIRYRKQLVTGVIREYIILSP